MNPTKTGDELRSSGRVSSCCYTGEKDLEVITTSGTYPWTFETQMFSTGQPSNGGDVKTFEVMIST